MVKGNNYKELLHEECSSFFTMANNHPLYKNLPLTCGNFSKVKVRLKKKLSPQPITGVINTAFKDQYARFRERAVFTQSDKNIVTLSEDQALYYVFPVNGFKFLYNPTIQNTEHQYTVLLKYLSAQYNNEAQAIDTTIDVMSYTYTNSLLHEGMEHHAEIILFNMSHYYCVKATINYDEVRS